MKKFLTLIILLITVQSIDASTVGQSEFNCPICTTTFTYTIQYSYSIFGKNLDLKPVGAAIIPSPIPKCPKCGFVYADEFFSDEDLTKLKDYLKSNKIVDIEKKLPNYYYLAAEMLIINRPAEDIAWIYLQSVWENDKKENYQYLANKTIAMFDTLEKSSDSYNTGLLIKIDLLRRMRSFNDALKTIEVIKNDPQFYKDYIVKVVNYQIELINKGDVEEHSLPQ